MLHRGYYLVALVAAAIAFAAFGLWLVTLVLVALAATLGARDVLDDEPRAQRMAVVATTIAPEQRLDQARLEQLVDSELRVLSGNHTTVTTVVEALPQERQIDGITH